MLADVLVDLAFQDPAIVESSGLVVSDGLFVTTNDSGDSGRIFTVESSGTGPAVVEDAWSTIVVPPGYVLSSDAMGHLWIREKA